ncbi:KpsF/GutQ family sugar-phosphate isomerase [Psychrobium sp. 1_MG-2023]|uniref:KpsF/GutQ family sugar-phosphate isomerase n=1 Tax=Psychrobium sp. 1_MG-2023 TaxID=3062624 RepID=UPI000C334162|nr:KpsF/GutQ family sugar-phosphate isomerase [Psychrobium sp. 1_MG-2023]MDP2560700.1 KpsF/GutQ family sugar-phosphate isomerase [Psychrobium sp. 1_MG-2023]PKF56595.1 D-arabinose 5-phosphate isomerase [Alteromonadales bacterium alter-6D02]
MPVNQDFCLWGQQVVKTEIEALQELTQYINDDFANACQLIINCTGKVVVMGMGKSGHIARKIAATLASTGTPAFFVHPGEASHGDLGMITADDVVLSISNSGASSEILTLYPVMERIGVPVISMTGNPTSSMAKLSQVHLCIAVSKEACPLGLAPTSSTTATLAMGDALAVALLQAKGFTADDFALSHPGGALGRKLLLRVLDVAHTGKQLPLVTPDTTISHALLEVSNKGLGMTGVVNDDGELIGLFTDGDLRRTLDHKLDFHHTPISQVMTNDPVTLDGNLLAASALKLMEERNINGLFILEDGKPIGALNMLDMLKAGVV